MRYQKLYTNSQIQVLLGNSLVVIFKLCLKRGVLMSHSRDMSSVAKQIVRKREGHRCQMCGEDLTYEELQVHHTLPRSQFVNLIDEPDFAELVCFACHKIADQEALAARPGRVNGSRVYGATVDSQILSPRHPFGAIQVVCNTCGTTALIKKGGIIPGICHCGGGFGYVSEIEAPHLYSESVQLIQVRQLQPAIV